MKKFREFLDDYLEEYFEDNYPDLLDEVCQSTRINFETVCCDEYSKNPRFFIFENTISYESFNSPTKRKTLYLIQKKSDKSLQIVELVEY